MNPATITPGELMTVPAFLEHARGNHLPLSLRLLLVSDGSLTRLLRGLSLTEITIEPVRMVEYPAHLPMAERLEVPVSTPLFHREVWLMSGGEKLVFASSDWYLPQEAGDMDDPLAGFVREFKENDEPVGDFIRQKGLWCRQEGLQIGRFTAPLLGIEWEGDTFWGRRYLMRVGRDIRASITEIFSPGFGE